MKERFRKKVLHVVNISFVLPYFIGDQFVYFKEKGIDFFVACSPDDFLFEYAKEQDFTAIPTNIHKSFSPFSDLKAIFKLIGWIKKENMEIVVGHTPKGALVGMVAAYISGVNKRIYFRHGIMYETSTGFKRFLLKSIERLTAACATKVVCVSQSVLEKSVNEKLNGSKKNILLKRGSCNGVNLRHYSRDNISREIIGTLKRELKISEDDYIVGYVGRLVNDKGINELIEAWKILKTKYSGIKLLLVGPYEERDSLGQRAKKYISQESSIIHTGLVKNVAPYYKLMNVFVLPSYREGLGTAILEASAMELPIITTRSTGCKDAILKGCTGLIAEINGKDIAKKITYYKKNKDLAVEHGKNGRKFVSENFDREVIWKAIEDQVLEL